MMLPPPAQPLPEVWRVSQRHLELLEQCPRRYQREIIEKYALPPASLNQQALEAGKRFHHLLQQRSLGIYTPTIDDPKLQRWLDHLENRAPELLPPELLPNTTNATPALSRHVSQPFYQAEHERTWLMPTWRSPQFELTVRYDALIATPSQAIIIDWKTYAYPRFDRLQQLQHAWQTRLYCYVLAQTSHYVPEQISMLYWFAASVPEQLDRLTIAYDSAKFQQDEQDLDQYLSRLHQYLNQALNLANLNLENLNPQLNNSSPTSSASANLLPNLNQGFSTFPSQIQLTGACSLQECPCAIEPLYPTTHNVPNPTNTSHFSPKISLLEYDNDGGQAIISTATQAHDQVWDLNTIPEITWIQLNASEDI